MTDSVQHNFKHNNKSLLFLVGIQLTLMLCSKTYVKNIIQTFKLLWNKNSFLVNYCLISFLEDFLFITHYLQKSDLKGIQLSLFSMNWNYFIDLFTQNLSLIVYSLQKVIQFFIKSIHWISLKKELNFFHSLNKNRFTWMSSTLEKVVSNV